MKKQATINFKQIRKWIIKELGIKEEDVIDVFINGWFVNKTETLIVRYYGELS